MNAKNKPLPSLKNDAEAENFLAFSDFTQYDLSGFQSMKFEMPVKEANLNIRLPAALMEMVRTKAKARSIPYARYVRMVGAADAAHSI